MYNADRRSKAFIDGVHDFLSVAEGHKISGLICCLCRDCKNEKGYSSSNTLHVHLLQRGFMPNYICWTKHGKRGVIQEEDEDDEENIPDWAQYGTFVDTTMSEAEEDDRTNALGEMFTMQRKIVTMTERRRSWSVC